MFTHQQAHSDTREREPEPHSDAVLRVSEVLALSLRRIDELGSLEAPSPVGRHTTLRSRVSSATETHPAIPSSNDEPEASERRAGGKWQDAELGSGEAVSGLSPDQQQGLWGVGSAGRRFDPNGGYQIRSQPLIKRSTYL